MNTIFNFVYGPMLWIAFFIFIGGCLYKIASIIIETGKKENMIFSYISLKYGLRSILMWIIPFNTVSMRKQPVFTAVSFLFHICIILSPIFLVSHVMLVDEAWDINWFTIPDKLADLMTIIVVLCCIFFAARRIKLPVAKYLTTKYDYFLLAIVVLPFLTGFFAYHQIFSYKLMMFLHILTGEIMLIAIPFTKLNHIFLTPFTRAYTGSEFGGVRHAKDW